MVDVDGHRVHIYCTGEGDPTVVVASGGFSFDWGLIQPEIAKTNRICTYDPAGTAWSEPVPGREHPACSDRVWELNRLLHNADIAPPYVLVGFSIGGLVARLYAARYPKDVVGMVLVDHAFVDAPAPSASPDRAAVQAAGLDSPPVLLTKTPIVLDLEDDENFTKLPAVNQKLHRWALTVSERPTPEMATHCFSEVAKAEAANWALGEKPLAVVSTRNDADGYAQLQNRLLALSHKSKQFVAENSTHMVIIDQPETVIQAIRFVISSSGQ